MPISTQELQCLRFYDAQTPHRYRLSTMRELSAYFSHVYSITFPVRHDPLPLPLPRNIYSTGYNGVQLKSYA
ncbi:Uu.00g122620.m01.CDS01 [Anthostomella pinea]|uniref:Uu.00g122620.m01.CDS01 n=1 Tax=Anthostomella pinea TaxID=933095 RepID=A0AAI8VH60_9PEZI|nr:Uu.00g122620.m01.CDS01 [Anthostomella pinea]